MSIVNIHDAKTNFSKLINKVLAGEEVIIAKGGKPLVRLTVYSANEEEASTRVGGQLKGMITIADDFDSPLPPEVLSGFIGGEDK